MSKTLFMFKNNYHPAFVMGFVGFAAGIFFLCTSGLIYAEILDTGHYDNSENASSNQDVLMFFIGTLVTGFSFIASSIGVMRQNKIARNIVVVLCLICMIGLIIVYGTIVLEMRDRLPQIMLFSGVTLFFVVMVLSVILVLTGNNSREYFGEDKIDAYENLLDNV